MAKATDLRFITFSQSVAPFKKWSTKCTHQQKKQDTFVETTKTPDCQDSGARLVGLHRDMSFAIFVEVLHFSKVSVLLCSVTLVHRFIAHMRGPMGMGRRTNLPGNGRPLGYRPAREPFSSSGEPRYAVGRLTKGYSSRGNPRGPGRCLCRILDRY